MLVVWNWQKTRPKKAIWRTKIAIIGRCLARFGTKKRVGEGSDLDFGRARPPTQAFLTSPACAMVCRRRNTPRPFHLQMDAKSDKNRVVFGPTKKLPRPRIVRPRPRVGRPPTKNRPTSTKSWSTPDQKISDPDQKLSDPDQELADPRPKKFRPRPRVGRLRPRVGRPPTKKIPTPTKSWPTPT